MSNFASFVLCRQISGWKKSIPILYQIEPSEKVDNCGFHRGNLIQGYKQLGIGGLRREKEQWGLAETVTEGSTCYPLGLRGQSGEAEVIGIEKLRGRTLWVMSWHLWRDTGGWFLECGKHRNWTQLLLQPTAVAGRTCQRLWPWRKSEQTQGPSVVSVLQPRSPSAARTGVPGRLSGRVKLAARRSPSTASWARRGSLRAERCSLITFSDVGALSINGD